MMRNLANSLLHRERNEIIPSGRHLGMRGYVLAPAILMLLFIAIAAGTVFGGSATWRLDPGSLFCPACWDYADNWTPATEPNGPADTATFDVSNVTGIGFVADII